MKRNSALYVVMTIAALSLSSQAFARGGGGNMGSHGSFGGGSHQMETMQQDTMQHDMNGTGQHSMSNGANGATHEQRTGKNGVGRQKVAGNNQTTTKHSTN